MSEMKVSASVRAEFERQLALNAPLGKQAKSLITRQLPESWHYEERLKKVQSFAQKLETGRFDPGALEDFFACTVVVPTLADVAVAETLLCDTFDQQSRRPKSDWAAVSRPTEFLFDHLRLYMRLRPAVGLDPQPVHSITFEVQVKTFLQHAWSIATHDLTYKSSTLSWGKERIAAQAKAALEVVEVSIAEASVLITGKNVPLNRIDSATTDLLEITRILDSEFDASMPSDKKRLSLSVHDLLRTCGAKVSELEEILIAGKLRRAGTHPSNLSPYSTVVQYLVELREPALRRALAKQRGTNIFIVPEIEFPPTLNPDGMPRARLMKTPSP